MNAAPEDCTNLVRLPEAVVYFVKLDCSPCMFVLFATHVPEREYQVYCVNTDARRSLSAEGFSHPRRSVHLLALLFGVITLRDPLWDQQGVGRR